MIAHALARYGPRLVIMAKEPVAGRVKTRLARDVGTVQATGFFRTNLAVTVRRLAQDPRWQTILAIAPDVALKSAMLPAGVSRMGQGNGDLSVRLAHIARTVPPGPLIVIGADIPNIHSRDIAAGFAGLCVADVVFGPSGDGGYWLIGLSARARLKADFPGVRWSTVFALADTKASFTEFRIGDIASKDDVDDGRDLARLASSTGRLIL